MDELARIVVHTWPGITDVQVSCVRNLDHYIPPLWIMCMESVAHLMVMLNFSSNFLIYCWVSKQFKETLSKSCLKMCMPPSSPLMERSEYAELDTVAVALPTPLLELSVGSMFSEETTSSRETDIKL